MNNEADPFRCTGAGKGTQAEVICKHLGIPAISTGNILREALKSGTEMGLKAKAFMDAGQLVPDEIVIGIIKDRLAEEDCKNGFILDGFPRTIPQAEALDASGVVIDRVIDIEVPDEKIVTRMSGRRVCEKCGSSYHLLYKKPAVEGVCTNAAAPLFSARMTTRIPLRTVCASITSRPEPLKEYYEKQGKLHIVEGQEEVADTTALTLKALEA